MCDTLVLHGSAGKPILFGKNSDREPEEPQVLVYIPPREPKTALIRDGVEFSDKGYAMLLSKPSWMRGGEMGINGKSLAIGNEAVFSRFKPDEHGVLGMDILRAALSACATAQEAVEFITSFVETYPQGGNGAYRGRLIYHNSFIVADSNEAYVVETAGTRWAWRKAMIADAISNAYCIEDDYKRLDAQTRKEIAPVNEKAACSDEADPGRKGQRNSWKRHVEDARYLFFTKGERRRATSLAGLMRMAAGDSSKGGATETMEALLSLLRSHEGAPKPGLFLGRMKNLCVHPGIFPKSATTASMAVEYLSGGAIVWYTDSSYPCVSLYKPAMLKDGRFYSLWKPIPDETKAEEMYAYWHARKAWAEGQHRLVLAQQQAFVQSRDEAQRSIIKVAHQAFESILKEKSSPQRLFSVYANEVAAIVGEWEDRWGD
jgi:secernin